MSEENPCASIVLPVHDHLELTRTCVRALIEHTPEEFELIVVDNGSTDDFRSWVSALRAEGQAVVYLRNERNEGFGFASNQGIAAALGEWIVLINNDVIVTEGWLTRLLALARSGDDIAMVGPRTNRASGPQVLPEAAYDDLDGLAAFARRHAREHAGEHRFLTRIVALCVLVRRSALFEVGGFDPCFWLGNFEDDDLCLRLVRRGYRIAVADDVYVHHFGSATWRRSRIDYARLMQENWEWFCHKWNYQGEMTTPYPALRLAKARAFAREVDYVPFRHEESFAPEVEPLPLVDARPHRLLLFADLRDERWREVVRQYCLAFGSEDPTTLIVRMEPPSQSVVTRLSARLEETLARIGLAGDGGPDILVEQSELPPHSRGALYRAAGTLLLAGSPRDGLYAREALSCGLPMVNSPSAALLRDLPACAARK